MVTHILRFGGIAVDAPHSWTNMTEELCEGPGFPWTLAKPHEDVGALQFTVALYTTGEVPHASLDDLATMLAEFAESRGLGNTRDVTRESSSGFLVCGATYALDDGQVRVWYASNGRDFATVTFVHSKEAIASALVEAEGIVRSLRFDGA